VEDFIGELTVDQLKNVVRRFVTNARGSLRLAQVFAGVALEEGGGGHHLLHPQTLILQTGVCGRCGNMGPGRDRENICCRLSVFFTAQEYFRATALDHNVLQLQIRLHADHRAEVPNYHANGLGKLPAGSIFSPSMDIWEGALDGLHHHVL
jgi:hypothetical protein